MKLSGVKVTDSLRVLKKEVGGSPNLCFTASDAYNALSSEKAAQIEGCDGNQLIKYFAKRHVDETDFYYDFEQDDSGALVSFFWRDGRMMRDYHYFGDLLVFDTTYRTNKYGMICAPFVGMNHHGNNVMFGMGFILNERTESFDWLFDTFLHSMGRKSPITIMTDQAQAIAAVAVAYSALKDAAGVAGNIFAFGLFVSPIPTFRRIIRNGSTEEFSGLPYIYTLLNCMICAWYGSPFVSVDNILITTVNSTGAIFQIVYISLFIAYAERVRKMKMLGFLSAVVVSFAILVTLSLRVFDFNSRQIFVGFLSCASLISMFASPLFIIRLVIRTKSVEYMPFYLSLSSFLMSMSFFTYGMLNWDAFIYVPNGIGALLAIIQLGLYGYYSNKANEEHEPLIVSYS
uniref:MULE transposase domain-containing protein n=1 Tax=Chenopodium quinoa TaxID=63459 RepID=A0A803LJ00_CHEQI